jgi:hypothetical protein
MARGVAAIAATTIVLGLLVAGLEASGADLRRTVAVLPVVVHASGDDGYLRSGVADMLASRLGQTPGVAVIRVNDPAAATTDLAAAREAAGAVGAEFVLFGSFTRFGEGASLDVRCASVTPTDESSPKAIFIQSPSLGELIPRLDGLAEKIGHYVAEGRPAAPAAVAAPAPAPGNAAPSVRDLGAQLEELRRRVEALEARLPVPSAAR